MASNRWPLVLMDIRMHEISGITLTRRVVHNAADDPPRVLGLATFDLDEYLCETAGVGVCGLRLLLNDNSPKRLLSAIKTIVDGDMLYTPTVTCRLIEEIQAPLTGIQTERNRPKRADRTRVELLRLVATGLSNTDIARPSVFSEATAKTRSNRTMMTKMNFVSRAQAVVFAYESGLVRPGEDCTGSYGVFPAEEQHGTSSGGS